MSDFIKANGWSILGVIFAAGFLYSQLQGVATKEDDLSADVRVVNDSIAKLDTDVKVLDTRTTRDEHDIEILQSKISNK